MSRISIFIRAYVHRVCYFSSSFEFRVRNFEFRVGNSSFELTFRVSSKDFRVSSKDFRVSSKDFRVSSKDFRVSSEDFRVSSKDFRVSSYNFLHRVRIFQYRAQICQQQVTTFKCLFFQTFKTKVEFNIQQCLIFKSDTGGVLDFGLDGGVPPGPWDPNPCLE